jgi:DNA-binding MarR family transcriptional regulator
VRKAPKPRMHVMARLLQHGPLTYRQAREITGWPGRAADYAIDHLRQNGEVERVQGTHWGDSWRLTDSARVRAFAEGERA